MAKPSAGSGLELLAPASQSRQRSASPGRRAVSDRVSGDGSRVQPKPGAGFSAQKMLKKNVPKFFETGRCPE